MLAGMLRLVLVFIDEWRLRRWRRRAEAILDDRERPERSTVERLIRSFDVLDEAGRSEDPARDQGLVKKLRELPTV